MPIVMIHEGEGCHLTVELRSGHVYRGVCVEAEDNMNLQMKDVTVTHPHVRAVALATTTGACGCWLEHSRRRPFQTGKESTLGQVYIQGKEIVFVKFPDILKHAPMFKRVDNAKHGKHVQGGMGFGRTRAIRTKGASPFQCGRYLLCGLTMPCAMCDVRCVCVCGVGGGFLQWRRRLDSRRGNLLGACKACLHEECPHPHQ